MELVLTDDGHNYTLLLFFLPSDPCFHLFKEYIFKIFRLEDLDIGQPNLQDVHDFVKTAYLE